MTQKKSQRQYDDAFKQEAVNLVLQQGYTVPQAAQALGIAVSMLYRWKNQLTQPNVLDDNEKNEKVELLRLRSPP